MVRAAVAYPLSFPEVSAVLLGTKTAAQAESNFGEIPGVRLSTASVRRVLALRKESREASARPLLSKPR
jgi:aryl-alcohol dehydrogenase-like predicted oxidoreductase